MAKKPSAAPLSTAPHDEEMVVTVVKFKGSGETLRKGIDALTEALSGAFGAPRVKHLGNGRKPLQITAPVETTEDLDVTPEPEQEDDEQPPEQQVEPAAKPKKPSAIRYSFLDDFNLAPNGVPSLKDFADTKKVETEQDRYLVVTHWLQTHGAADPFIGNQVFTCFRGLDWTPRKGVMQPVREMKSKKSWFTSPTYGKWKLTQPGLDAAVAIGPKP
jgi:hypothetical protein